MNVQVEVKPEDFLATNPLTNPFELALLRAVPEASKAYADWQIVYVEIDGIVYKTKTPENVEKFLYDYYAEKALVNQNFKVLLGLYWDPNIINEEALKEVLGL